MHQYTWSLNGVYHYREGYLIGGEFLLHCYQNKQFARAYYRLYIVYCLIMYLLFVNSAKCCSKILFLDFQTKEDEQVRLSKGRNYFFLLVINFLDKFLAVDLFKIQSFPAKKNLKTIKNMEFRPCRALTIELSVNIGALLH